mgnify:FL=1
MFLVFDTETTGLPRKASRWNAGYEPHVIQLAAFLFADDGRRLQGGSLIVDPGEGVEVEPGAARVHGITTQIAREQGVPLNFALAMFAHLYGRCEEAVAFNAKFDVEMLELSFRRQGSFKPGMSSEAFWTRFKGGPIRCAMEPSVDLVGLPPTEAMLATGRNHAKTPKLAEAYRHFFGEEMKGAHDAAADADACARVWVELRRLGAVSKPASRIVVREAAPTP